MDKKRKSMLTPDDIQMLAEMMQYLFSEQEKKIDARFSEQEMKIDARFSEQEMKIDARFSEQEMKIDSRFAEQEKKFDKKYANKEEMKQLIRDTVEQVVEEKVIEKIGRLPTREEFFARMDVIANTLQTHEQELTALKYQVHNLAI